ncbi:MAG: lipid-A-disaccharide synthase [Candidatus Rokubacteria bacterium]|nr:lipid-A-disaccharide synthase [Candidatus Rokubacteria bacterium]
MAGEASGDLHGATLAQALATLAPERPLFGMGGRRMSEAGVELLEDVTAAAVVGGSEAIGRLPRLWRAYRHLAAALDERRPGALVVIDFPDFNLRLARVAHRAGVPVVYFIPPQVWAWRARRVETMRKLVSLVLAVFPFEPAFYRRARVPVEFVGHPILDALVGAPSRAVARRALGLVDELTIGLLPGSRREEIARVMPAMRDAAARIAAVHPTARFVLGLAPTIAAGALGEIRGTPEGHAAGPEGHAAAPEITVFPDRAHAVMRASDVLLVASGTATLEAALLGTPMVVCYRVSRTTEAMARLLVRVPWISLANLVLGRAVVPELYQARATGEHLAAEALRLIEDTGARDAQRDAFGEMGRELGEPGVGARAAAWVLATAA